MAARPDLRIGDAEREARAAELREHFAQGRLSLTEFNERLSAVFAALTQQQLDQVTADLPHVQAARSPLPGTAAAAIPPGAGGTGSDRPGQSGVRGALAMLSGLAALAVVVLAGWLLVRAPGALHLRGFPFPGRVGILLAVLAIVRGLIRRIFGLGRRGRWGGGASFGHHGHYGHGGHWHGHQRW